MAAAAGAIVFITDGSPVKRSRRLESGASLAIDYRTQPFDEIIRSATISGKSLTIIGTRLGNRPLEQKTAIRQGFEDRFRPLFTGGRPSPVLDSIFPVQLAGAAHEKLLTNDTFAKLILSIP